jgi:hydroxymethylpyrimidine/phosphomethylpyrimidine kinase
VRGRVLVVAGSDSSGGAGIQADIKTIAALGGYAMTAITALTAQDTRGIRDVHGVPAEFVRLQMELALDDIGADAVKIGMLGAADIISAVAAVLQTGARGIPVVLDPVMTAKGGRRLLDDAALAQLKRRLLPFVSVLTPNLPEAERLCGMAIPDEAAMRHAARALLTLGVPAVLLKGGHLPGDEVVDLLASEAGITEFRSPRIATRHTHGTGCTLASAIATGLAQQMTLNEAVARACAYVQAAIANAPGYGAGHGPLNHAVSVAS